MMRYFFVWVVTLFFVTQRAQSSDQVLTFELYLQSVMKQNQMFESLRLAEQAALQKRVASDMDLVPQLTATLRQMDDRRLQPFGQTAVLDRTEVFEYQLGVSKKWSTGTVTQVSASLVDQTLTFGNPLLNQFSEIPIVTGQLGLSIQQSLWKDGFGGLTALRQTREDQLLKISKLNKQLNEAQSLIQAEQAFWDYVYFKEELKQRKESLERARKIEVWSKNRLSNGLAEESDLLGSQALVALRELQLAMAQDALVGISRDVKQSLQIPIETELPLIQTTLSPGSHPLHQKVTAQAPLKWVRLDYLITKLEADLKATVVSEVKEQLKPDLALEAKYNTNSIEDTVSNSLAGISDPSRPTQAVGFKLSWAFGGDAKTAQVKSAQYEKQSALAKAERLKLESDFLVNELTRRYQELGRKVEIAQKVARLQTLKAKSEQTKLARGRAVTSQVIQAEQEASESELTLIKLKADQLKLLSQFRLFHVGDSL